ncbi:ASB18 protein, partial [Motacilla alba]|nr:ASB18 protein [Motacilla alba]
MSEAPGAGTGKLRISSKLDPEHPLAPRAPIARFYTALVTGDLRSLQVLTERYHQDVNLVFEISKNQLEWQVKSQASYGLSGLWALEERLELSTPLCLAARHGHSDCLRHLLRRGADPNLAPGGQGPLHQACLGGHSDCVELLLEYRAQPNARSEQGAAPLHLCTSQDSLRCAQLLLMRGAAVELPSEAGGDTALHSASHPGGLEAGRLGTSKGVGEFGRASQCGQGLGSEGGEGPAEGQDGAGAAHRGFSLPREYQRRAWLVSCLVALRSIDFTSNHKENIILPCQAQAKMWLLSPLALPLCLSPATFPAQVLKSCAAVPEVIEVLFNSYSQIPVSQEWAEAVPEEVFQQHQLFYESLLGLAGTARSLQHLCRAAIRAHLGNKCHSLVPLLPVPAALRDFLLLEPQGVVL